MTKASTFYITTPIYYVNDYPHIGHAYTTLACDILARFKRLDGYTVHFLTGTDEHGQKVEKAAIAKGVDPQAFTDDVSHRFRDLTNLIGSSHDDFIRTTEDRHKKAAQAIWQRLVESGNIYLDSYSGWYSTSDEAFYDESELIDGRAPSGSAVEWVEEPSYFFKLSAWEQKLLDHYDRHPDFVGPASRRNEVISFVKGGLSDLSVSRTTFKWGIAVPENADHVMYVWLDALTNYLSALEFPNAESGLFMRYWPCDVHMVGKDILRFHAVYWPAFLMAAGLQPPKRVFAHGWWTNEGRKISKSLGNVIDPFKLVDEFGLDQFRYFAFREVPFGNDGDFSRSAMIRRINSDLANDYGNLCQRVLTMIGKNCNASVPQHGEFNSSDADLMDQALACMPISRQLMEQQSFHQVLETIWRVIAAANRYIDKEAPWTLKKTDPQRMETVLYVLAETIRRIAIQTQPFIPTGSNKILDLLAIEQRCRDFASLSDHDCLVPGTPLPKPVAVFPRFTEDEKPAT